MYIFDLDGTITDSNGLWMEVDDEFLARRGLLLTGEYQAAVGRSTFPAAAEFTRAYYGIADTSESIMAEWEALAAHHYAHLVELKEGAPALLEHCRAQGIPAALYTACRPALCKLVLERYDLEKYFCRIVFAEELGVEKHDPRAFPHLCELLGVKPEECVLFDDCPDNCAAARSAGLTAVGVYDRFYAHRQEELRSVCHRCVRELSEVIPFEKW